MKIKTLFVVLLIGMTLLVTACTGQSQPTTDKNVDSVNDELTAADTLDAELSDSNLDFQETDQLLADLDNI